MSTEELCQMLEIDKLKNDPPKAGYHGLTDK
jgi:hypothetical protein